MVRLSSDGAAVIRSAGLRWSGVLQALWVVDSRRPGDSPASALLGRERDLLRSDERLSKPGKDRQIGVKRDRSTPRTRSGVSP